MSEVLKINLQELIPYIRNFKKQGSQYVGECPCCGDDHHLYIKETDNHVLLYCQKCQAPYEDIVKALGVTKEYAAFEKVCQNFEIMEQYGHIYRNTDGTIAYYKTRTKYADGKKKFMFHHEIDGVKKFTKPDGCNCLYNLDLIEQASSDETLYIVEGEKCADSMTSVGFLATTANGGANSVKLSDVDKSMLAKFTEKVIIPDNDEPGQKYIKLFDDAKVLNLSDIWNDIKPKQDIADFIEAGMNLDLMQYISECLELNDDILPRHKAISHMGWCGDEFMPYTDDIRFDGDRENHHLHKSIGSHGDFDKWKSCVSELRRNIYLRMTMAASFASPLIEIVNGLPFVYNLWGTTNTGKSVALMVAMSIWGDPSWGKLSRTMNATVNSMMSTASFLHNLPFGGDELQTVKSTWDNYDKLIMCVCEGVERGRMNYDRNNETRSWKCSFIFTGEEPCTQSSSGGGVKNRVIDVQVNSPIIEVENGSDIAGLIKQNYGHAGKVFIEYVQEHRDEIDSVYKQYSKAIMKNSDTTDKQAQAMALMLTGDKFARDCIFTDEPSLKMSDIEPFLTTKLEVDTSERAYQFILNHMAQHETKFDSKYAADVHSPEMWGRIIESENIAWFNKNPLTVELRKAGFEFDAVKERWAEKGYLIKNSQGRYHHGLKLNGVPAMVIKITLPEEFEMKLSTD